MRPVRRLVLSLLIALSLPALAAEPVPDPLAERAFWVGAVGAGATLVGGGLWLESVRRIDEATARGDGHEAQRARYLGAIGGSLAFTGVAAMLASVVLSSWRAEPVGVSLAVTPSGQWSFAIQGRLW